jgi:excisionase family DNA binding protein
MGPPKEAKPHHPGGHRSAQGQQREETSMKLYTVREVAELLRCSASQVYHLVEVGVLRCYRITTGKQGGIRFDEAMLAEFLRCAAVQPQEPPAAAGARISLR